MFTKFKKIIKNNYILIFLNILFATFSGCFFTYMFSIKNQNETIQSFLIIFQEMTYPAIQELLTFPIFNNIVKELKKHHIDQISSKEDIGSVNTNFLKINEFKTVINKIFFSYKQSILIFTMFIQFYRIYGINFFIYNMLFFSVFCLFFIFSQKILINKKKQAWTSTENTLKKLQYNILNIEDVKQNLISMDLIKNLLDEEAKSWFSYSIISNLILLGNSFLLFCYFFLISPINIAIGYLYIKTISKFPKNIQTLILYYYDFQFLRNDTISKNLTYKNHKNLIVKNLKVYNVGPFNFEMKEKILIINGNNGAGKTAIAKSIAKLIPFEGEILSPSSVYIGLDSFIIENPISKGQRILKHIELALKKNYILFILDEVLDILSKDNFNYVLQQLKNKQIIIISHKNLILDTSYQTLNL